MKTLPRHISQHHTGAFDVRVRRGAVEYRARVATLARALEVRDAFLAQAGPGPASNTGLAGITESVRWSHNHAYPAFCVSAPGAVRRVFTHSRHGGRRPALRAAAAFRARHTGERITPDQIEKALSHV
jgi:hypothetical protein